MKIRIWTLLFTLLSVLPAWSHAENIRIATKHVDLIYTIGENGRLHQLYFGRKLMYESDINQLTGGYEAYLAHGMEDYFEPAIHVEHSDHNSSLELKYISHTTQQHKDGGEETVIVLGDDKYPVTVKLYYITYPEIDIIKTYTEISHQEKKPIKLHKYASSMLHLKQDKYVLTEFAGDWVNELNEVNEELHFGKKVLDSKLGTRTNMFTPPFFQLSMNELCKETSGDILMGTLGWTGNFRFTFEVDQTNRLRIISGINPYFSTYELPAKEIFRTPEFIFTYSFNGKGQASRNFHDWARNYQLKDGNGDRMTLLNNWEATEFDFNEEKLINIFDDAVKLGVDMFLLDDGWFGNKYPRHNDTQGLGDWQETKNKLPNGVNKLIEEATKKGVKFGIWIEPEMVNPKSELYEKHKDWAIHYPNRNEYYFRNQLVLDLSNPEVQDFVFGVVDELMTKYPGIAFFKWDCNSPMTNIYSPYLKDKQTHLYVDYVRGLYKVLDRIKAKYPKLPMMLCSGGGARGDYKALSYFTEFWASDNTNPIERLFIQWGCSEIFPSKAVCAHVTSWKTDASIKFRTEVAMMGKLGFDMKLSDMNPDELAYCQQAVKNYNRLKPAILDGDLYRLVSPYSGEHTSTMFVTKDQTKAVVFAFDIYPRSSEKLSKVRLQGLVANKQYKVQEINLRPGEKSTLADHGKVYSGDFLMKVGLDILRPEELRSIVLEIEAQ